MIVELDESWLLVSAIFEFELVGNVADFVKNLSFDITWSVSNGVYLFQVNNKDTRTIISAVIFWFSRSICPQVKLLFVMLLFSIKNNEIEKWIYMYFVIIFEKLELSAGK